MPALEALRTAIKTSTSSMTSVPKPLKFLRPRFGELVGVWEGWDEGEGKVSARSEESGGRAMASGGQTRARRASQRCGQGFLEAVAGQPSICRAQRDGAAGMTVEPSELRPRPKFPDERLSVLPGRDSWPRQFRVPEAVASRPSMPRVASTIFFPASKRREQGRDCVHTSSRGHKSMLARGF